MVAGAKPSVNEEVIRYQARTKLAELADVIAAARKVNSPKTQAVLKKAKMIYLWLKALDYKKYLSREQREKIWYALIHIADVNDFPIAPLLEERTQPDILIGSGGGDTIINNTFQGGTAFQNSDVDTPSEVVDTFATSLSNGVRWEYTIINSAGTALRKGSISAGWLTDGSAIESGADIAVTEIGDTSDVVLSVDINDGNVRLIATVASSNWIVKGKRYLD